MKRNYENPQVEVTVIQLQNAVLGVSAGSKPEP